MRPLLLSKVIYLIISGCHEPYFRLHISGQDIMMSSIYEPNFGPENMFDDDANTIAHTRDAPDHHKITIDLSTPQTISSVILMNRGSYYVPKELTRLNNTKVTLFNPDQHEFFCGYVQLQSVTRAEVVTVICDNLEFLAKQIVISKLTEDHAQSLNIGELRVCYLPKLRTYKSSIAVPTQVGGGAA